MSATVRVRSWGHDVVLSVPKRVAEAMRLRVGQMMLVDVQHGLLIYQPVKLEAMRSVRPDGPDEAA